MSSSITFWMRSETSREVTALRLMNRLTVATETPARRATSRIVTEEEEGLVMNVTGYSNRLHYCIITASCQEALIIYPTHMSKLKSMAPMPISSKLSTVPERSNAWLRPNRPRNRYVAGATSM